MVLIFLLVLLVAAPVSGQDYSRLRIIAFGAHPDDCDSKAGGLAAKYAAAGHLVKFVSVTNGDAGHYEQGGGVLAKPPASLFGPAIRTGGYSYAFVWV